METASRLVFAFVLNAAWQVPVVAVAAAAGARLLPSAAARHRLLVAALGLGLVLPLAGVRHGGAHRPEPEGMATATTDGARPGWVDGWRARLADAPPASVSPPRPVAAADLKIAEKDGKLSGRVTFYLIHQLADGRREVGGKDEMESHGMVVKMKQVKMKRDWILEKP